MFTTSFEDVPVYIDMEGSKQKALVEQGVNPLEIFRVIDSFSEKLLAPRKGGEIRLENEETQATIDVDIVWVEEKEVRIQVVEVDLNIGIKGKSSDKPKEPRFDFTPPPLENEVSECKSATN